MTEPLSRLYDLALRSLDEQARRADAIRARLAPVLAAAALGATLLSGPVVGGERPATVAGRLALTVAAGGLTIALLMAFRLVSARHRPPAEVSVEQLLEAFHRDGTLESPAAFYRAMIARLTIEQEHAARRIDHLAGTFSAMLRAVTVMLCGLAIGALVG